MMADNTPAVVSAWPTSTSSQSQNSASGLTDEGSSNNITLINAAFNPRYPSGVIIMVLMLIGICGNSLVLYVYHFKKERTVFTTFVTALALLDLSTALITMPIDVAIKMVVFDRTMGWEAACKVAHFEVYASSIASGSILLLITVARYRKVCKPFKPGLTLHRARVLCCLIVSCSAALCSLTFAINGLEKAMLVTGKRETTGIASNISLGQPVAWEFSVYPSSNMTAAPDAILMQTDKIPQPSASQADIGEKLTVVEIYICRTDEPKKGTTVYFVLQAVLILAFVVIFVSLIVLHCKISLDVVAFARRCSSRSNNSQQSNEVQPTHITGPMFRIFMAITIIFLVSYLPHLICLILELALYKGKKMRQEVRVGLDLAYNVPYINIVANPFIYGYMSADFRSHSKALARRLKYRCCHPTCKDSQDW